LKNDEINMNEKLFIDYFQSFIGLLEIKADERYLLSVKISTSIEEIRENRITHYSKKWLKAYFKKIIIPIPPLKPAKTKFSNIVREKTLNISFGECKTYSDIAKKIKNPKAYRAVAQVLKHNPYMIIVPCHRVISKKGIGGYNSGIEVKEKLLKFENCKTSKSDFEVKVKNENR